MKKNIIIICLISITTALISFLIIQSGLPWYQTLKMPDFIPPANLMRIIWSIIYILTTLGAIIVWNETKNKNQKATIALLFFINIILHITWILGFFHFHLIEAALIHELLLNISIASLIIYLFSISRVSSALLIPYMLHNIFLLFVIYQVYILN